MVKLGPQIGNFSIKADKILVQKYDLQIVVQKYDEFAEILEMNEETDIQTNTTLLNFEFFYKESLLFRLEKLGKYRQEIELKIVS